MRGGAPKNVRIASGYLWHKARRLLTMDTFRQSTLCRGDQVYGAPRSELTINLVHLDRFETRLSGGFSSEAGVDDMLDSRKGERKGLVGRWSKIREIAKRFIPATPPHGRQRSNSRKALGPSNLSARTVSLARCLDIRQLSTRGAEGSSQIKEHRAGREAHAWTTRLARFVGPATSNNGRGELLLVSSDWTLPMPAKAARYRANRIARVPDLRRDWKA